MLQPDRFGVLRAFALPRQEPVTSLGFRAQVELRVRLAFDVSRQAKQICDMPGLQLKFKLGDRSRAAAGPDPAAVDRELDLAPPDLPYLGRPMHVGLEDRFELVREFLGGHALEGCIPRSLEVRLWAADLVLPFATRQAPRRAVRFHGLYVAAFDLADPKRKAISFGLVLARIIVT